MNLTLALVVIIMALIVYILATKGKDNENLSPLYENQNEK